jgi:dUTP pyrophosphatase
MDIKIKKLTSGARIPTYATDGSGAFDLYVDSDHWPEVTQKIGLHVLGRAPYHFGTGLSFEIPKDHVMLVFSRSGHGFNYGARLSNCVGVIDSDFRGEVKVALTCDMPDGRLTVKPGDRIAQALIIPVPRVQLLLSDELGETSRGDNGFGSTGS